MADCGDLLTNQDLSNAKKDATTISEFVESNNQTTTSKEGKVIRTLQGINNDAQDAIDSFKLKSKGQYLPDPVTLSDGFEYVVYLDKTYFAVSPPYTTDPVTYPTPDLDTVNLIEQSYLTRSFGEKIAGDGDSQLAGGNIWPLSSQDSAQDGDILPANTVGVRLSGSLYYFERQDGTGGDGLSDELTNINTISIPATAEVGGVPVYLCISKWYKRGKINVLTLGAPADGVLEDTAAFQAGVDSFKYIEVPDEEGKIYRIQNVLCNKSRTIIQGIGSPEIRVISGANNAGFIVNGPRQYIYHYDLRLSSEGNQEDGNAMSGIRYDNNPSYCETKNIRCSGFSDYGIRNLGVYNNHWSPVTINCNVGLFLGGTSCDVYRGYFSSSLKGGLWINGSNHGAYKPVMEQCGQDSDDTTAGLIITNGFGGTVVSTYFEANRRNRYYSEARYSETDSGLSFSAINPDNIVYSGTPFNERGVLTFNNTTLFARRIRPDETAGNTQVTFGNLVCETTDGGSTYEANWEGVTKGRISGVLAATNVWETVLSIPDISGDVDQRAAYKFVFSVGSSDLSVTFDTVWGQTGGLTSLRALRGDSTTIDVFIRLDGTDLQLLSTNPSYGRNFRLFFERTGD